MKRIVIGTLAAAALVCVVSGGCAPRTEELTLKDMAQRTPQKVRLLLENDSVSAYEISLGPGDSLPMHYKQARAVFGLTYWKATVEDQNTRKTLVMERRRNAHWFPAGVFRVANSANSRGEAVVVIPTASDRPQCRTPEGSMDLLHASGEHATLLLENEHIRVVSVTLGPGDKLPGHHGCGRLVYWLTPAKITFVDADGRTTVQTFGAGDAHWYGPGEHSVENLGQTSIEFVVFELRRGTDPDKP